MAEIDWQRSRTRLVALSDNAGLHAAFDEMGEHRELTQRFLDLCYLEGLALSDVMILTDGALPERSPAYGCSPVSVPGVLDAA